MAVILLAACGQLSLGGSATAEGTRKGSSPSSASSGESPPASGGRSAAAPASAHDLFVVQDLKIGMPVEGHAGFTCEKVVVDPGLKYQSLKDRHCVKFTDSRCAGRPASVGTKRYGEKAPLGCFLDYSSEATYLDDTLLQEPNTNDATQRRTGRKPLHNLHLVGTQSKPSKIYRIKYMFAEDQLTEDSKLYKALVAKYGEPSYKNAPIQMRWKYENTEVEAYCVVDQNCSLSVADGKFEDLERRQQEEADAREKRQNAPDAPKL